MPLDRPPEDLIGGLCDTGPFQLDIDLILLGKGGELYGRNEDHIDHRSVVLCQWDDGKVRAFGNRFGLIVIILILIN